MCLHHWLIKASFVLALGLVGCSQDQQQLNGGSSDKSSSETPSAMDHTYHGEAVKARARAMQTLRGVDTERKELQREEQSFERPTAPTPRENP